MRNREKKGGRFKTAGLNKSSWSLCVSVVSDASSPPLKNNGSSHKQKRKSVLQGDCAFTCKIELRSEKAKKMERRGDDKESAGN